MRNYLLLSLALIVVSCTEITDTPLNPSETKPKYKITEIGIAIPGTVDKSNIIKSSIRCIPYYKFFMSRLKKRISLSLMLHAN